MKNKGVAQIALFMLLCIFAGWLVMFSVFLARANKRTGDVIITSSPAEYQCVNGLLLQQDKAVMAHGRPVKC